MFSGNRCIIFLVSGVAISVVFSVGAAQAEQLILVNFGYNAYTSDGSNTWQTFNLSSDSSSGPQLGLTGLSNSEGESSGISLEVTGVRNGNFPGVFNNQGANSSQFESPASGTKPSWFNALSTEQRQTAAFFNWDVTYVFSGFAPSDTVQFDFVVGGAFSDSDRALTLSYSAPGSQTLMNDLQVDNVGRYATLSGLTGSTSYSFLALASGTTTAVLPNAIGVTVQPVPEPSAFALAALGLLGLIGYTSSRPGHRFLFPQTTEETPSGGRIP